MRIRPTFLGLAPVLGLNAVQAATWIGDNNVVFTAEIPEQALSARPLSWADINNGGLGPADHSTWGTVNLRKGKKVTITVLSDDPNFHPGISVWYRPQGEGLVNFNYAWSHFYRQTENIIGDDVLLEVTREPLGDMRMWFIRNAWDQDGAPTIPPENKDPSLTGIKDKVRGRVRLTFTPKQSGIHQFAVGGYDPGPDPLNPMLHYPLTVSIKGIPVSP